MSHIDFLNVDDLLQVHRDQVSQYGGDSGVRDLGLLQSAIAQPQSEFNGQLLHAFPFEMAAAYLFHLVKNHPFVDGNKRARAVAGILFLNLNGFTVTAPQGVLYELTISVANGTADKQAAAEFFQTHAFAT